MRRFPAPSLEALADVVPGDPMEMDTAAGLIRGQVTAVDCSDGGFVELKVMAADEYAAYRKALADGLVLRYRQVTVDRLELMPGAN